MSNGKNDKATEKRASDKLADLRYEARHNRDQADFAPVPPNHPTAAFSIEPRLTAASHFRTLPWANTGSQGGSSDLAELQPGGVFRIRILSCPTQGGFRRFPAVFAIP